MCERAREKRERKSKREKKKSDRQRHHIYGDRENERNIDQN